MTNVKYDEVLNINYTSKMETETYILFANIHFDAYHEHQYYVYDKCKAIVWMLEDLNEVQDILKQLVLIDKIVLIKSNRQDREDYKAIVLDVFVRDNYAIAQVDTFFYGVEECLVTSILKVLS